MQEIISITSLALELQAPEKGPQEGEDGANDDDPDDDLEGADGAVLGGDDIGGVLVLELVTGRLEGILEGTSIWGRGRGHLSHHTNGGLEGGVRHRLRFAGAKWVNLRWVQGNLFRRDGVRMMGHWTVKGNH